MMRTARPSGAAGGIVTKNPRYRQRYLLCESKPYDGELLPREDAVRVGELTQSPHLQ